MNYRHAFHAGNFADVMKHVLLTRIISHLRQKPAPFRVIDTHAGIGFYDLSSDPSERTGEWRNGIGRLDQSFDHEAECLISPYRGIVADTRARFGPNAYPGSPTIVREMLRTGDRAIFIEKHPEDERLLRERFNSVRNTKVLTLDGWTGLKSLIPPKERRGLVLIDPPYEETGELGRAGERLAGAVTKWPGGIFALWYPIKDLREADAFYRRLVPSTGRGVLRAELLVDGLEVPTRLNGCGLAVINPPWTLAAEAAVVLPALASRLGRLGPGGARCHYFGAGQPR